jgi:hypothetical protein
LITSDPQSEVQALELVVSLNDRPVHGRDDEWHQFCLSLAFGPSVLEVISKTFRSAVLC